LLVHLFGLNAYAYLGGAVWGRDDIVASMKIPFHMRPKVMGFDPDSRAIEGSGEKAVPYALPFKQAPEDQRP